MVFVFSFLVGLGFNMITLIKKCFKRKLLRINFSDKKLSGSISLRTLGVEVESSEDGVVVLSEVLFESEQYSII